MREQIMAALDQVRPFLQRDGGDVEFVDYTEDKTVLVRLQGHCAGCPHAQMTIKYGIEQFLKDAFGDAVSSVEAVM
ncbi:MAG: NifU family protein [Firmicutes bacterium]|jgi:Fe-S cluster biogenesis protein NfuA|nr:NifU family protein [Bacillota bacterium]MBQ2058346.1 NifU family protein [Bacillota bacterium]MBQ4371704.1 NifU family protein [Bacillota bacterium]